MRSLLFLSAMFSAAAFAAQAEVVLDQENPADGSSSAMISDGTALGRAQTFTVGASGILASIDIFGPGRAERLDILATDGGVPLGGAEGSTVLASTSVSTVKGDVQSFDFSAARLHVDSGTLLAFMPVGDGYIGASSGRYQAGDDFYFYTPDGTLGWQRSGDGFDTAFRTYVDVAPVPSGGAVALFGLAVARRKRARAKRASSIIAQAASAVRAGAPCASRSAAPARGLPPA